MANKLVSAMRLAPQLLAAPRLTTAKARDVLLLPELELELMGVHDAGIHTTHAAVAHVSDQTQAPALLEAVGLKGDGRLATTLRGLDEALCGGIPAGKFNEIVGPSGIGKTQDPEQLESPKQRKAETGVNLRRSLSWDSAFFTSEGLLDAKELAVVNSTFHKEQGSRLSGITKEMRLGESTTSTLESENWVLESLETDNVCASIKRSLGNPGKASGVAAAISKPPKCKGNVPCLAERGVYLMPQSKTRPPISTSHGVAGGKQRPQATSKEPTASTVAFSGHREAKSSLKSPLPIVATMKAPTNTLVASGVSVKRNSTGVVSRQTIGKSTDSLASTHFRPDVLTKSSSTSKSGALPSSSTLIDNMPLQKTKSPTLGNKSSTVQRIPVRSSRTKISKINPSPSISPSSADSMCSVVSGASTASTSESNDRPPTAQMRPPTITERQPLKAGADAITQGNGSKPSRLRIPTPRMGYFDPWKPMAPTKVSREMDDFRDSLLIRLRHLHASGG